MPCVVVVGVAASSLVLSLRRVSPKDGSKESGRGVIVRLPSLHFDLCPSREIAVIHDLNKRIAWSKDGSLSRAIRLT